MLGVGWMLISVVHVGLSSLSACMSVPDAGRLANLYIWCLGLMPPDGEGILPWESQCLHVVCFAPGFSLSMKCYLLLNGPAEV